MTLPNFLVIGAQKSGTKWLHRNMSAHPRVFVPFAGGGLEVHYFDSHHMGSTEWYSGHFKGGEEYPFRGDITPNYGGLCRDLVKEIYELLPDAKIIYTLRNPKERAISAVRMELKGLTFEGNPREHLPFDEHSTLEDYVYYCCQGSGFHNGNYPKHLDTWFSVYPRDQMLVLSYDLLRENPQKYLTDIYEFLEVSKVISEKRLRVRVHESVRYPMPPGLYQHLDETYDPLIRRLADQVPFDVSEWLTPAGE